MEYWTWNFALFCFITFSSALLLLQCKRKFARSNLRHPPGPRGWPVVGHVFSLGTMPHRTIRAFNQQYGPIIWLKLGAVNTMVIGKADAAANFFKNHDSSFTDRTLIEAFRSHDIYKCSFMVRPFDTHHRLLRRLCNVEMFSNTRMNESGFVREKCVNDLLLWVKEDEGHMCEIARLVLWGTFNIFGNMVLSRDLVDPKSKVGSELFVALIGLSESFARPNVSSAFPWLRPFDLQGIMKKMDRDMGKVLEIVSGFVKQRIVERQGEREEISDKSRRKDFLDILLDFEGTGKNEPAKLSEREVTIFILEMFVAASDSSSSIVEWALAELLHNPKIMIKVKAELTNNIGQNKKLEDKHLENLTYLQAVIKETLRLHPPAPFLALRRANKDVNFLGYHIPHNTQVFVNVWAIGRDPECWHDPLTFNPQRFLDSNIDFKGQHFEYLPFGAGRRMCPGIPLAQRSIPLILGSLLHEFEWELESHVSPETLDMEEKMGMTLRKLVPLKVIPKRISPT